MLTYCIINVWILKICFQINYAYKIDLYESFLIMLTDNGSSSKPRSSSEAKPILILKRNSIIRIYLQYKATSAILFLKFVCLVFKNKAS